MNEQVKDYMNRVKDYYVTDKMLSIEEIVDLFKEDVVKVNQPKLESMPTRAQEKVQNSREHTQYHLDLEELNRWRIKNNNKFEVRSHLPIKTHRKYIGRLLINGKKIVRKCLKWYIDPIVEQQNEFNGSVTASVNSIYNQSIILNEFMRQLSPSPQQVDTEIYEQINCINEKYIQLQQVIDEQKRDKKIQEDYLNENKTHIEKIYFLVEENKVVLENYEKLLEEQVRVIKNYEKQLQECKEEIERNKQLLNIQTQEIKEQKIKLGNHQENLKQYQKELNQHQQILETQQADISYLGYKTKKIKDRGIQVELIEKKVDLEQVEVKHEGLDYFMFENRFRGSREKIKATQIPYIEYFKGKSNILDIGCGRGEFLELLSENGIEVKGIDIYSDFVEFCRDKGLDVKQIDALKYVNEQPNNSLGGIFMGQVVEHLEEGYFLKLVEESYDKLQNGGYFIAETPNPTNLTTFTNSFYLDPSHIRPIHPETFKFILESIGFKEVKINYTQSSRPNYSLPLIQGEKIHNLEEVNSGLNCVSDLIFGSLDYAIIARK